jgi:hypothetical protein
MLTKQNLRGMSAEVRNMVKTDIINALIDEHWNSIYRGVILATGQENVSSYTASLNCYQHIHIVGYPSIKDENLRLRHKEYCHLLGLPVDILSYKNLVLHYRKIRNSSKQIETNSPPGFIADGLYQSGPETKEDYISLYVPNRDLQYDEPTLTNINLAKRRIIQFKFNSTEIEDILEFEIERKIIETFPDINITKPYSECCQKFILKW